MRWIGLPLFVCLCAAPPQARADDEAVPRRRVDRPLLLPRGHVEVAGDTVVVGLWENTAGYPVRIAPSIRYGISDDLSVGVFHDRQPTLLTLLPDSGLCLHNTRDDGEFGMLIKCFPPDGEGGPRRYDDIGLEVLRSLMRQGVIELAAHVRFFAVSLDDATLGASGGVTGKLRFADAFLTFDPSFYVGFNDRERGYDPSGPYNTEALYLPLRLSYQIGPAVTPFVSLAAGVKTADPDGSWLLLGGAGVDVAITSSVDLGAELMVVLDSGWPLHPTAQWSDFRTGILRVAVRF